MKKSVISIALCVALLMSSLSVMFVMPVSAANGVDFLTDASISVSDGATAETVDGNLVFTATAAGQEMALVVTDAANLNDYPYWEASYTADMAYDICWNDANNGKWIFGAGDFCYNFEGNSGASNPLPAATVNAKFSLTGAYTWNGSPLPANAAIKQIIFIAKAPGTITVSKCALTDGLENFDLNTESYSEDMAWANTMSLLDMDPAAWGNKAINGSDVTVAVDGDSLVFGTTAGNWPSAYLDFETPYVVPVDSAIFADFSVKQSATIYVFFANSTSQNYVEGEYVAIKATDLPVGNYTGTLCFADIVPANCIDEDGNVTVNAISVYAIGDGNCVTVNALDLLYNEIAEETTTTTEETTTTTTVTETEPTTTTTTIPEGDYIVYTVETVTHEGTLAAGEEVTLNITASEAADVNGVNLHVAFDDAKFELVGYTLEGVLAEISASGQASVNVDREAVDGVKEVWVLGVYVGTLDTAADEVIMTITLKAKADITEDAAVTLTHAEVTSAASTLGNYELAAAVVDGGIVIEAVEEPALKKGDLNGDGEVTIADAMQLFYHVAEKRVITNEDQLAAADVNGDGIPTIADAMKVFYFVAEKIPSL